MDCRCVLCATGRGREIYGCFGPAPWARASGQLRRRRITATPSRPKLSSRSVPGSGVVAGGGPGNGELGRTVVEGGVDSEDEGEFGVLPQHAIGKNGGTIPGPGTTPDGEVSPAKKMGEAG